MQQNVNYTSSNERFSPFYTALSWAGEAAHHANAALFYKEQYAALERLLRKWTNLTVNSPIWPHTVIFIIFAVVDILISIPIFEDVMKEYNVFSSDTMITVIAILSAFLINAWAAVTAHFLAKGWYKEHQDLERWNLIFIKLDGESATPEVETYICKEIRRAKYLAFVSGIVLLGVVGLLVYHRYHIRLNGQSEDGIDVDAITYILTFLPIAIVIGEIITGDYVWYIIQRWRKVIKRNRLKRSYSAEKAKAHSADNNAYKMYNLAIERNEPFGEVPKDLKYPLIRVRTRTAADDNYCDPIVGQQNTSFQIRYADTGQPLARAQVYGVLANGAKTGDYYTNEKGEVGVHWTGDFDRLEILNVRGKNYAEPFMAEGMHYLEYQPLMFEGASTNGASRSASAIETDNAQSF